MVLHPNVYYNVPSHEHLIKLFYIPKSLSEAASIYLASNVGSKGMFPNEPDSHRASNNLKYRL